MRNGSELYAIAIAASVAAVGCGATLFSGDETPDASSTDAGAIDDATAAGDGPHPVADAAFDGGQETDAAEGDANSCAAITCVTPPQCQEIPGTPYCDAGVSACAYEPATLGFPCDDGGSICNGTGQCE